MKKSIVGVILLIVALVIIIFTNQLPVSVPQTTALDMHMQQWRDYGSCYAFAIMLLIAGNVALFSKD